jgi:hypothetical protein
VTDLEGVEGIGLDRATQLIKSKIRKTKMRGISSLIETLLDSQQDVAFRGGFLALISVGSFDHDMRSSC